MIDDDGNEAREAADSVYCVSLSMRTRPIVLPRLAKAADHSISGYLRRVGLGAQLKPVLDLQLILELVKINGDQGRLGGLLKLWLSERPGAGASAFDVRKLLRQVEATQTLLQRRSSGYDRQAGDARQHRQVPQARQLYPQSGKDPAVALIAARARNGVGRRITSSISPAAARAPRACRITNCASVETEWAIREIELTQGMNQRAKGSRTYHLVVSFPAGERPTQEQLIDIENELCAAIGLGSHQRISAVHTDTDHLHIHVAINQIHPQTYNCVEPWYDKAKLMKACERLEVKHGLQRTYHGKSVEAGRKSAGAVAMEQHRGVQSLQSWIREEALPHIGADIGESSELAGRTRPICAL